MQIFALCYHGLQYDCVTNVQYGYLDYFYCLKRNMEHDKDLAKLDGYFPFRDYFNSKNCRLK